MLSAKSDTITEVKKAKRVEAKKVEGMGPVPTDKGVGFRVWAPHAKQVFISGDFNNWSDTSNSFAHEENGYWYAFIDGAKPGQQYKYILETENEKLSRNDPYAREVSNSNGNSIIHDPEYNWEDENFQMPDWNALVIYELHVGTFYTKEKGKPGTFLDVIERLPYLKELGINAIEIMPPLEFPGGFSWGYNPSHPYALETEYGGPKGFKDLVKAAHKAGIAILLDIVYNHFGPDDLDLWQFDGWNENGKGGIYFYQDWRSKTPWGDTRPDFGRAEVRQYIRDNALMWLEDYRVDGLRTDAIAFIRNVEGEENPGTDLPDGWSLMRWINEEVKTRFPWKITIAEDLRSNEWITKTEGEGGQGFSTQWDACFVYPVREALTTMNDSDRNMHAVADAIMKNYNGNAFQRVIYTESHDEVANGRARVPEEISPGNINNWFAKKRSTLGGALVMTAPGIPMMFQGQDLYHGGWFEDTNPIDWTNLSEFKGIVKLYSDLINLRKNVQGYTKGLTGQNTAILHINNDEKIIAFHRWYDGGPKDSTVVVLNFADRSHENYNIGVPEEGLWKVRFNSDWKGYSEEFGDNFSFDTEAHQSMKDGQGFNANISIAPYSALILSRD
jgi:1,4-alpha-glucan branching enzyme